LDFSSIKGEKSWQLATNLHKTQNVTKSNPAIQNAEFN
jgi:hypothetical protein